jgi:hypothetical protein
MSSGCRLLLFGVDAGDWTLIQHCANRTILILDLAPPFLVATGVEPPDNMDGRPLPLKAK